MILMNLEAGVDAIGTVSKFYVSTHAFCTSPVDSPSNTAFVPALIDPGFLGVHAYSDGRTGGATKLETGEAILANGDGQFDAWLNFSFDGRPVTIRSGSSGPYPGAFPIVLTGTVESIEATRDTLIIRLRDLQYVFTRPALSNRYAGTNALPNGLEGTPDDLKGKAKPKAYGAVFNVAAPCVNTQKLTYQVNDGGVADIPAVYDRAGVITKGADYATSALLQAAAPAAGTYITCFAEGFFRLGIAAGGLVTADVIQGATAADRTVAQILKRIALDAGVAVGSISAADIAALDAMSAAVVGVWVEDSQSFQQVMDSVAISIGAWYGFDGASVFRMGRLTAPAGVPVLSLGIDEVGNEFERRPARDNGIPVWRATVNHTKIWSVQPTDVVGSVTAARRIYLANEYRSAVSEDPTVKTQYLLASTLEVDTLLTTSADATAEVARQSGLNKTRRDIFEVPVHVDVLAGVSLNFMDVISLTMPRFGLDAGKLFRLIGRRIELANSRVILTLWG